MVKITELRAVAVVVAVALVPLAAPGSSFGAEQERAPVAETAHFTFYSHLATNLNDALIAAALGRRFERIARLNAGPDPECLEALPPAERAGWEQAVDFYAEIVAPSGNFGDEQGLLRNELARLDYREVSPEDQRFLDIAGGFLAAARPAYEACRWAEQDAANRRWIDGLTALLSEHEEAVARRLEELYGTPFHGLPLPVDVVGAAPQKGASSITLEPGGHILISSLHEPYQGLGALEIVFHEASHTVVAGWRDDPLPRALADAAETLDVARPDGLWHAVLFYTTGEAVRRILEEAGEPGYTPYLYQGLFERAWPEYQGPIESTWPAYLDGERTLSQAATELLRALSPAEGEPR